MLPGFRFLFTAIMLSMSALVFGLGAAAFLRAAHEQFASNPSWHAAPEPGFALQNDAPRPVLSMLRVEDPAPAGQPSDIAAPAIAAPVNAAVVPELAEPAAIAPSSSELASSELERVAALAPQPGPVPATPELPISDGPAGDAASAHDAAPAAQTTSVVTSDSANEIAPPAPEAGAAAPPPMDPASLKLKIARLDSPFVALDTKPAAKAVNAAPDTSAVTRRLRARRAALRRRLAAERARQLQITPQAPALEAAQQVANPFAPLFEQPMPLLPAPPRNPRASVPVNQNGSPARPSSGRFSSLEQTQAGPVATGGPSGSPHSAHDPSYSAVPRTPSR